MKTKIQLGDRVKDAVTGFEGIAVCLSLWLNGCVRITVQPEKLKDGSPIQQETFDEPQLAIIKKNAIGFAPSSQETGGPVPNPKQHCGPVR